MELLQRRQEELLQRQRDAEEIYKLKQAYENYLQNVKEDKLQIQNQLGNFYGNQKKEQQDREIAMRTA